MKIAIYHPNMQYRGGGETVALTIASLLKKKHEVTVFVIKKVDVTSLEKFFGLDLKGIKFEVFGRFITMIKHIPTLKPSLYARSMYKRLNGYDVVIDTCTNGLFEKKVGKKSICYVHFPNFPSQKKGLKSILNPFLIKQEHMFCYDKILCNSEFTQQRVAELTRNETHVVYPPVKTEHIHQGKKKNIIVTIGRFSPEKKLEVLIESFKKGKFDDYELHIIGATGDLHYQEQLEKEAKGYNIIFHEDMPHDEVLKFLSTAKYYWHARGYGEKDPVEYENFGITTVEAMAAGCIPIVINLGAQPEIVKKTGIGYTWNQPSELIDITKNAKQATKKLGDIYSIQRFEKELKKFI